MGRRARGKSLTTEGHECDSIYERDVLQGLIAKGVDFEYEPESIKYRTKVRSGSCGECGASDVYQGRSYTPDVRFRNGTYLEIKGKFMPAKRTLMRAFVRENPELTLRFLFYRDNWLTTGHKRKYSDFCRAIGCESDVGTEVPEAWYS